AGCVQNVISRKSFRNRIAHDNRSHKLLLNTPGVLRTILLLEETDFLFDRSDVARFLRLDIIHSGRSVRAAVYQAADSSDDEHNHKNDQNSTRSEKKFFLHTVFYLNILHLFPNVKYSLNLF